MKKVIIGLMLVMLASVSNADEYISLNNMTAGQKAQLLQQVDKIEQEKKQ